MSNPDNNELTTDLIKDLVYDRFNFLLGSFNEILSNESIPKVDREYGLQVLTDLEEVKSLAVKIANESKKNDAEDNLEFLMFNLNDLLHYAYCDFKETNNLNAMISHLLSINFVLDYSLKL